MVKSKVLLNLIDCGLSILHYTDDTTSFMDHDIEQAKLDGVGVGV